tara:strand:- start:1598 stop:2203 length:606 start_codon:yes stop_codon:yes gene_type:complete
MEAEKYYHIFNRANGDERLFRCEENYRFFLQQWQKYISPIATSYVYCLLPNHFHFLIQTHSEEKLCRNLNFSQEQPFGKFQTFQKVVSKQFSNLFSSYTQALNKMYGRHGSLFSPNFKRKEITTENYLRNLVCYIHANAVHHGLSCRIDEWKHSSYTQMIEKDFGFIDSMAVIQWFEDLENLIFCHLQKSSFFIEENELEL